MIARAKNSLVGGAYEQLRAEILCNHMPPGYQAPEAEIALRLSMSRTPVREALIRLEAEGLVELIPRRGARVLPISAADMAEIYEILLAVEPEAAANFAARQPDAITLAPLEAATRQMEKALEAKDLDAWGVADDLFHQTLLALHGNRRLSAIVSEVMAQAHRARIVTLRLRDMPYKSTADHRDILDALRAGASDQARTAFRAHRRRTSAELLALLENYRLPGL
ncbi:MAG: GntR family transcriptional regulator [Paracoccaceae bacterium]